MPFNQELRTKNWKVMEALQSAEKALQCKVTASEPPAQDLVRVSYPLLILTLYVFK